MRHKALNQLADSANKPWSTRMAASALSRYSIPDGHWHYKDGLLFTALLQLCQRTWESRYWQSLTAYVDRYVGTSGEINTYSLEEYNIDQINPGKLLFPLYEATGEERYRKALWLLRKQIHGQPRTKGGGFWHKQIYPYQMWLDGTYMCLPFYAHFAMLFDDPAAFDDIAFQMITIENHTRDPFTGLLYHAWDESCQQRWANSETGCSPHFWCRAMGWYVMAIVDVLDHFPKAHTARPQLVAILRRGIAAIATVQDEATGLWWQVLDQGGRTGNYLEASGTCMFVYAIGKGIRNGYLEERWITTAVRAFEGLVEHMVTVDDEGQVDLHGICASAGLGGNPYRDGSFEYYIGEPIATNDLHGVGPFILAAIETETAQSRSTNP